MADTGAHGPERFAALDGPDQEQLARSESRVRRVNEAIDAGRAPADEAGGFLCECGRLGCTTVLEIPSSDYATVRADFRRFLVAPGHQAQADEVLEERAGYLVVAKRGAGADIARRDPRDQGDAG